MNATLERIAEEAAEVEAAWDEEIEKRAAEVAAGKAPLLTSEEFFSVFAEAMAVIQAELPTPPTTRPPGRKWSGSP